MIANEISSQRKYTHLTRRWDCPRPAPSGRTWRTIRRTGWQVHRRPIRWCSRKLPIRLWGKCIWRTKAVHRRDPPPSLPGSWCRIEGRTELLWTACKPRTRALSSTCIPASCHWRWREWESGGEYTQPHVRALRYYWVLIGASRGMIALYTFCAMQRFGRHALGMLRWIHAYPELPFYASPMILYREQRLIVVVRARFCIVELIRSRHLLSRDVWKLCLVTHEHALTRSTPV